MRTLLVVLAFPAVAAAQPMDLYGFNPRAVAMAGVEAASDGNFTAAYYNPALLKGGEVGIGFNWGSPSMSIQQTGTALPNQELSAQRPVDYAGITVGAAVPLDGLLKGKATVGLAVYSPIRHVFRSHLIDEGTAYFLRYDSAPERLQLSLSAAVHPLSWLSVGAGFQVSSNYGGAADFSAVLGTTGPGRVIRRRLDSDVIGAAGPIVGVAAGPFKTVRIFGFWRGELKTEFTQPINVDLGTFGSLDVSVRGITQYSPHVGGLGASVTLFGDRLLLAADVAYEAWSTTPQLVPVITINLPQTLQDLAFNARVDSRTLEMNFSDIVVLRLGAEWRQGGRLKLRAGYFYRPTMIPPQTGKSNFLDSNAHVVSLGAGWSFDDPLKMAEAITVDLAGQVTALEGGTVVKDGPNNNPNYTFGGTHVDLGIAVKYEL
jgi:long-chain fatty acid transport protein